MGIRFFYREFGVTDPAAIRVIWNVVCHYERLRVAIEYLHMRILDQASDCKYRLVRSPSAAVPADIPEGYFIKKLDAYYIAERGRWRRIDVANDRALFDGPWLYGGIPYSLNEKLTVLPTLPGAGAIRARLQKAADVSGMGGALAYVEHNRVHIGGWTRY